MALFDDLVSGSGASYFYALELPPGAGFGSGAGATATATASTGIASVGPTGAGASASATAAAGSALGYAITTVVTPVLNAAGSIFHGYGEPWGNFVGTPQAGDTIRYPTNLGFRIAPNGEVQADEYGTWTYFYNDGTGEVSRSITLDASPQVFAAGATANTAAADASLYGGVNIAGDAPDVTAAPATGTGTAGNIAPGAGAQVDATAPSASVQAGAAASGGGASAGASPATAVGENIVHADGAGVEAPATAPQGSASGDVFAVGGGVTAVASAASGAAIGDRLPGSIPYTVMTTVYPRTVLIARAAA